MIHVDLLLSWFLGLGRFLPILGLQIEMLCSAVYKPYRQEPLLDVYPCILFKWQLWMVFVPELGPNIGPKKSKQPEDTTPQVAIVVVYVVHRQPKRS